MKKKEKEKKSGVSTEEGEDDLLRLQSSISFLHFFLIQRATDMAYPYPPNSNDPYRQGGGAAAPAGYAYDPYLYPPVAPQSQQQQAATGRYPPQAYPQAAQPRATAVPNLDAFGRPFPTVPPPPPPNVPTGYASGMAAYSQVPPLQRAATVPPPPNPYHAGAAIPVYSQAALLQQQPQPTYPAQFPLALYANQQAAYGGLPQMNPYALYQGYDMQAYNAAMARSYQEGYDSSHHGRHRGE